MTFSLRARLVLGITLLMACGLLIANVTGLVLLRSYLMDRVDQQLHVPQLGAPPGTAGPRLTLGLCSATNTRPASDQQLPTDFVIILVDQDGTERCRLPRDDAAAALDLSTLTGQRLTDLASRQTIETVPSVGDTETWRVRVTAVEDGFGIIAVSLAEVDATVRRLAMVAAGSSAAILLLVAAGGFAIVRIGLRPLTAIEQTAEAIAGGDLSRRITPAPVRTEVGRLAASLNAMLTQIEQAFTDRAESEDRLRRFVADASHELRTPLATIRGHAELYRQGVATSPDEVALLLSRIESESVRMGALVEDLLLLARLDASPSLNRRPVDLLSLAADAVVDARAQDPGRPITLRRLTQPPWLDDATVVHGDEARLRQVLLNLLSNALRHTPPGSPIEVEVGVQPGISQLRVVDHGPGLTAETAGRVFERFYRGDPARARTTGGAGLGLSIVSSLVAAHDGSVRYEPTPGGGSTFVVSLAAASPS